MSESPWIRVARDRARCTRSILFSISPLRVRDVLLVGTPRLDRGSDGAVRPRLKGFGLVFFPVFALTSAAAGWALAGDQVRGLWRRIRRQASHSDR